MFKTPETMQLKLIMMEFPVGLFQNHIDRMFDEAEISKISFIHCDQ